MIGLLGQTNNEAVVFQSLDELDLDTLPKSITLYSQTTKSTDAFYEIKAKLEAAGITLNTHDTICRQVSNRDKELRALLSNMITSYLYPVPNPPMEKCCTISARKTTHGPISSVTKLNYKKNGLQSTAALVFVEPPPRPCG